MQEEADVTLAVFSRKSLGRNINIINHKRTRVRVTNY